MSYDFADPSVHCRELDGAPLDLRVAARNLRTEQMTECITIRKSGLNLLDLGMLGVRHLPRFSQERTQRKVGVVEFPSDGVESPRRRTRVINCQGRFVHTLDPICDVRTLIEILVREVMMAYRIGEKTFDLDAGLIERAGPI